MSLKLQETITNIFGMNNDDLNQVIMAVKQRRTWLSKNAVRTFRVGDIVSFNNRGMTVLGTVQKVNIKNIHVKQSNSATVWRVPANMLTPTKQTTN